MECKSVNLECLWDIIEKDCLDERMIARVFFTSNFNQYQKLVEGLAKRANRTIQLSDSQFCKGEDTIPDLSAVVSHLDEHKDETILIPHLGEYLRVATLIEQANGSLHKLLHRHVHSDKRIWIPVFAAQELFERIIGNVSEERFQHCFYELRDESSLFHVNVFTNHFKKEGICVDASGLRSWFHLWDNGTIKSNMTLATRHATQYTPIVGEFSLAITDNPFEYLTQKIANTISIDESLGTIDQWVFLLRFLDGADNDLTAVISSAFNMVSLDPKQILSQWHTLSANQQWLFFLFFKLNLQSKRDYLSYAISYCNKYDEIPDYVDVAIFSYDNDSRFKDMARQRSKVRQIMGATNSSPEFWKGYDRMESSEKKFQLLSNQSLEERTHLIAVISDFMKTPQFLEKNTQVLKDKYPDFYQYLLNSPYLDESLNDYIRQYKVCKLTDFVDEECSQRAKSFDCLQYEPRGMLLHKIQNHFDTYFLWIDGLGVEWIDLLLLKIQERQQDLSHFTVTIATSLIPTITTVNMDTATESTLSGKKFNQLDSLSHIKDKSNCNYKEVIASQIDMMSTIADKVVKIAVDNPHKDIVITADHGLSRLAALGFHKFEGIEPSPDAEVHNLGRYCKINSVHTSQLVPNTKVKDDTIVFETYDHFVCSGYAPGEIHGGGTPEEVLVPVIHFKRGNRKKDTVVSVPTSYQILHSELYLNKELNADLMIQTEGVVSELSVSLLGITYDAILLQDDQWQVSLPHLHCDKSYQVYVNLNGVLSQTTEKISIKRKGMDITDPLDDF